MKWFTIPFSGGPHFVRTQMTSLVAQMAKNYTCNAGDQGSIPRLGRLPGGGHGNQLQYSFLENPHGQAGYSPWGHKELDMTEDNTHVFFVMLVGALQKVCVSPGPPGSKHQDGIKHARILLEEMSV